MATSRFYVCGAVVVLLQLAGGLGWSMTVEELLEIQASYLEQFKTVEFHYTELSRFYRYNAASPPVERKVVLAGDRYFVQSDSTADGKPRSQVSAYNGQRHVVQDPDTRRYLVGSTYNEERDPALMSNPLVTPFMFAGSRGVERSFRGLTRRALWRREAMDIGELKDTTYQGKPAVEATVTATFQKGAPWRYSVTFAQEAGYYPLYEKIETLNPKTNAYVPCGAVEVASYQYVEEKGRKILIPTVITSSFVDEQGKPTASYEYLVHLDKEFHLNRPVGDSAFDVATTAPGYVVWDNDRKRYETTSPAYREWEKSQKPQKAFRRPLNARRLLARYSYGAAAVLTLVTAGLYLRLRRSNLRR